MPLKCNLDIFLQENQYCILEQKQDVGYDLSACVLNLLP